MNETIQIAELAAEGGGLILYGREDETGWEFWGEASRYDPASASWRRYPGKPADDLLLLLPQNWPGFYPVGIHPGFVGWFRRHYERACGNRMQRHGDSANHESWMKLLAAAP